MTKETFAALLSGREYPLRFNASELQTAKDNRLVIVTGASDDLVEFGGFITDEFGAPGVYFINSTGLLPEHGTYCECKFCGYKEAVKNARKIESLWCEVPGGPCWSFKTDLPHATFIINEDGEPFCRGIVLSMDDVGVPA